MTTLKEFISAFKGPNGLANLFVCMVWGSYMSIFVKGVVLRIPGLNIFADYCIPIIYVVMLLFAAKQLIAKSSVKDFLFWLICTTVFLCHYGFGPSANTSAMDEYFPSFILSVSSCVFIGKSMGDKKLLDGLYWVSIFTIVTFFFYNFMVNTSAAFMEGGSSESQGLSYSLLPHLLFVLWRTFEKFDILSLLMTVFAMFMMLAMGSRGPVLSVLAFVVLYLLICKKFYKYWYLIVLLAVGGYYIYNNITIIAMGLQTLLDGMGFSTRILDIMIEGESASDIERQWIVEKCLEAIKDKPFGIGLCGSFPIVGGYPHNLFLEFAVSFGWAIGIVLSILLIIYIIKGLICCQDDEQRGLLVLLISASVVNLLVSGTFLNSMHFYMLIGFCALMIQNKKNSKQFDK